MQEITEGRNKQQFTPAMIQSRKLEVAFELKAKYGITKGSVLEITRPVNGRLHIEKNQLPKACLSIQTEFQDFHAGDNCMYVGLAFDHWTGRIHMEFIGDNQAIYYDYEQHGPGDESIGEIFKIIIPSGHKQSVI